MFAFFDDKVKIELIYRNLHFPRVVLFGASQKRLSEEEAANPKHHGLSILKPTGRGRKRMIEFVWDFFDILLSHTRTHTQAHTYTYICPRVPTASSSSLPST